MSAIRILTEQDLQQVVKLDLESLTCVEKAFAALAGGAVVLPPILSMALAEHNGEVDVKTAYIPGLDNFAIKISPGFFDNPKKGLPSLNGLMVVLSATTGIVKAVLLDNGYLTDIRTAAAGAVAARWLAPQHVETVAVLGAGVQARLQIEALKLVRDFKKVVVWARDSQKAAAYAAEMSRRLGLPVEPLAEVKDCLAEAQIVVTTTPAHEPLIKAAWLHPGLHITAMGSDAADKNEIDPEVLAAIDLYVCDRQSQCAKLGELRAALEAGLVPTTATFPELGEIILGTKPGRTDDQQITLCDLTGTGVQDTAIANLALHKALDRAIGQVLAA